MEPCGLPGDASHGNREVVDALLALGADPDRRDRAYDATPSGWADHAGHGELAAFLVSHETPPEG